MDAGGRPEAGQRVAVKAVGRALQLVSFVLRRAVDAGASLERLGELTGWDPALVREVIERPPEPALVRRVAPAGVDSAGVARAAASYAASERLRTLTQEILADVDDERWSPAAAELDELRDRLERAWRGWRRELRETME
jgi:leucyl aminopeptidase (aminopeptidase T)